MTKPLRFDARFHIDEYFDRTGQTIIVPWASLLALHAIDKVFPGSKAIEVRDLTDKDVSRAT
jgi:hypothetical protein